MTDRGKILDELKWRGALNQLTDEDGLRKLTEVGALARLAIHPGVIPSGSCKPWTRLLQIKRN